MASIPNWTRASGTGTTITCTLDFTPTAGKVLLCCAAWDKSASSFTTPSGFTALGQAIGTSVSGAMFYKIADGTETEVSVVSGAMGASGGNVWCCEVDATHLVDSTDPAYSDTSVTSCSTGTASGTGIAVAFMTGDTKVNVDGSGVWSNSFTAHPDANESSGIFWDSAGSTGQAPVIIAYKDVTGTAESTYSVTDTGDQMWGAIAIFDTPATGVTAYARPAQAYASAPGKS